MRPRDWRKARRGYGGLLTPSARRKLVARLSARKGDEGPRAESRNPKSQLKSRECANADIKVPEAGIIRCLLFTQILNRQHSFSAHALHETFSQRSSAWSVADVYIAKGKEDLDN